MPLPQMWVAMSATLMTYSPSAGRSTFARILQPGDERVNGFSVRLFRTWRRHDAPAQFANGLFEDFRMLADILGFESLKTHARSLRAIVMAPDAVLIDHGQLFGSCSSCG